MDDADILRRMSDAEAGRSTPEAAPVARMLGLLRGFSPATREACPSRDDLVAHEAGELSTDDSSRVAAHLAACPFCAADLADYRALVAPPLFELVARLVADGIELVRHGFPAGGAAEPVLVRGDEPGGGLILIAPCDGREIEVRLQPATAESADLRLVLRPDQRAERHRLNLLRGDELLESRVAIGAEEITFAAVAAGDYTVAVEPLDGGAPARVGLRLEAA